MVVLFLVGFAAGSGGAPPPSVKAIWMGSLVAIGLGLLLASYIDRHRTLEDSVAGASGGTAV